MNRNGSISVIVRDAKGVEAHRQTHDVDDVDNAIAWVRELAPADDAPPAPKRKRSHAKKRTETAAAAADAVALD